MPAKTHTPTSRRYDGTRPYAASIKTRCIGTAFWTRKERSCGLRQSFRSMRTLHTAANKHGPEPMQMDKPKSPRANEALQSPAEHDTEEPPMSALPSWRPPAQIRVKAFDLHWMGDALLAAEVTRDDGTLIGIRPLGGSVNFAEPWTEALRREFREEIHVELSHIGPPRVIENIFEHEGVTRSSSWRTSNS